MTWNTLFFTWKFCHKLNFYSYLVLHSYINLLQVYYYPINPSPYIIQQWQDCTYIFLVTSPSLLLLLLASLTILLLLLLLLLTIITTITHGPPMFLTEVVDVDFVLWSPL